MSGNNSASVNDAEIRLSDSDLVASSTNQPAKSVNFDETVNKKKNAQRPRSSAETNKEPVILLIVDPQFDFHPPFGSLQVPGADEDSVRIAEMIKNNCERIDRIYVTMDSHHANHIAHKSFWERGEQHENHSDKHLHKRTEAESKESNEPDEFQPITHNDLKSGKWRPKDRSLQAYCLDYTKMLEKKFTLTIWPEHCLLGTIGHSVVQNIHHSLQYWTQKRRRIVEYIFKGTNCLTEMYSAIVAEVPVETDEETMKNYKLLKELKEAKRLIVCGQALSHCVLCTVKDILDDWRVEGDPEATRLQFSKMVLLKDGCSIVRPPKPYDKVYEGPTNTWLQEISNEGVIVSEVKRAFEDLV